MGTESWGRILLDLLLDVTVLAVVVYVVVCARFAGWWLLFAILLGSWATVGLVRTIRAIYRLSQRRQPS